MTSAHYPLMASPKSDPPHPGLVKTRSSRLGDPSWLGPTWFNQDSWVPSIQVTSSGLLDRFRPNQFVRLFGSTDLVDMFRSSSCVGSVPLHGPGRFMCNLTGLSLIWSIVGWGPRNSRRQRKFKKIPINGNWVHEKICDGTTWFVSQISDHETRDVLLGSDNHDC